MKTLLRRMFTLMMRILCMGRGSLGVGGVAAGDAKPGAIGAGDVEGVVASFATVKALERAVACAVLCVSVCFGAGGWVFRGRVGGAAEMASDCIAFELAGCIASGVAEAVAAGALAERRSGFKPAGEGPRAEDANGGLKDVSSEGPFWVVN
ncbi:MAG TPA: hypothetical protein VGK01_15965 [Candidatus Angelobacter sp.]